MSRTFQNFTWQDTNLRIACDRFAVVAQAVIGHRRRLEEYIARQPAFRTSFEPLELLDNAPEAARRMAAAASLTGLGPMAAVAGALAQLGAEAAQTAGSAEVIVENGGDMYLISDHSITVGIYAGRNPVAANLAFALTPGDVPLAICSSSSAMGHSTSLGDCDLATALAVDAALADAAATLIGNRIRTADDVEPVLNEVGSIPGIRALLAVKDDKIGLWGDLPQLVRNADVDTVAKITRDAQSTGP